MAYVETEQVELKEIYVPVIKKQVVAFANSAGGMINIGIRDDGEFVGVEDGDFTMRQVTNAIRDSISPDITMFAQVSFIGQNEKTAVKIEVSRGSKCLLSSLQRVRPICLLVVLSSFKPL